MTKHWNRVLFWGLLMVGVLCSGLLLAQRFTAERASDQACAAMKLAHVEMLAEANGMDPMDCLAQLREAGVRYFPDVPAPGAEHTSADGSSYQVPQEDLGPEPVLVLVENHTRTSMILPDGFDVNGFEGTTVKALYLYEDYADRIVDGDPQEIENLLFRAVTDRGLKLLLLEPFTTADGEMVTELSVYVDCLEGLSVRLAERGISFGEGFSALETKPLNPVLLAGAGMLTVLAGVWLVCRWEKVRKWELHLTILGVAGVAICCAFVPFLAQKVLMLGTAILIPSVGIWHLGRAAVEEPSLLVKLPPIPAYFIGSGLVFVWSLLGAFHGAALMSSRDYLLGVHIFSGVKLALLGPMAFAGLLLLWTLRHRLRAMSVKGWILSAVLVVGLCGAGYLFLVRSGDLSGDISGVETQIRNWLEYHCYARPRSKELFLAAPCVPLFFWACRRKLTIPTGLFGLGAALELVSVCNTFCHGVAPLHVSLARTLLAQGFGIVVGVLLSMILDLVWRQVTAKKRR